MGDGGFRRGRNVGAVAAARRLAERLNYDETRRKHVLAIKEQCSNSNIQDFFTASPIQVSAGRSRFAASWRARKFDSATDNDAGKGGRDDGSRMLASQSFRRCPTGLVWLIGA